MGRCDNPDLQRLYYQSLTAVLILMDTIQIGGIFKKGSGVDVSALGMVECRLLGRSELCVSGNIFREIVCLLFVMEVRPLGIQRRSFPDG